MSYASEVLADAPGIWYRCQEASGFPQDSSGNGRHITASGGAGSATYQQVSPVVSDFSARSIRWNDTFNFQRASYNVGDVVTLEAWVRRQRIGQNEEIINKRAGAYGMRFNADNKLWLEQADTANIVGSTITITDTTTFHHCVVTKNGATCKVYIDGVDVTGPVTNATLINSANALFIGSQDTVNYMLGYMTEIAIYPTALSAARVLAHFNAATAAPGSSFVNAATLTQETSVTSFPVSVPAGTQNGDFMIGIMVHNIGPATITRPGGWTALDSNRVTAGHTWDVSYRVASSEPASYTWTSVASGPGVAAILTYRGVNTSTPINASFFNTVTGTSQTWDNVTTTINNCMLVAMVSSDNANADGAGTYSVPSGYTGRLSFQDVIQRDTLMVAEKMKITAGLESGAATTYTTLNAGTSLAIGMLALTPATVGAPTAPQSVQATAGNAQIALTWGAPASDGGSAITGYKIYRSTSSGSETLLASPAGTGTSYTDSTTVNNTTYYYKITAVNANGESPFSSEVSGTPSVGTAPAAPQTLQATAGAAQVSLAWTAPPIYPSSTLLPSNTDTSVSSYKIYRGLSSGTESLLASPAGTGVSYVDSTAVAGTTYFYKVSAVNAGGESALSNESSATPTSGATVSSAPTGLGATGGNAQVALTWSVPVSNGGSAITAYKIYRSVTSGTETLLASPAGTGTAYTDLTTANGTTYFYKVTAVNAIGESALSNEAAAVPNAPVVTTGRTYARFYGPAPIGNTASTLYTCPAASQAVIRHIHVSNPSGSPVDFTLSIGSAAPGAGTDLWDAIPIDPDDVLDHYQEFTLEANEIIQAFASVGATLNVTIDGYVLA